MSQNILEYEDLINLQLSPKVWSLIQRGLIHSDYYSGTYHGIPGAKTRVAYNAYLAGKSLDSEPEWLSIARQEIGVKEFTGEADNPDVIKYLRSTKLPRSAQFNDETSWCSAFVNWCIERTGLQGTNNPTARSWLKWGTEIEKPVKGCIVVLWRGSPTSWKGHVGFFIRETQNYVFLLGGNQDDEVNISKYSKDRFLGYRML